MRHVCCDDGCLACSVSQSKFTNTDHDRSKSGRAEPAEVLAECVLTCVEIEPKLDEPGPCRTPPTPICSGPKYFSTAHIPNLFAHSHTHTHTTRSVEPSSDLGDPPAKWADFGPNQAVVARNVLERSLFWANIKANHFTSRSRLSGCGVQARFDVCTRRKCRSPPCRHLRATQRPEGTRFAAQGARRASQQAKVALSEVANPDNAPN